MAGGARPACQGGVERPSLTRGVAHCCQRPVELPELHVAAGTRASRAEDTDQFRIALEASPTGMLMIDAAGHIVLLNAEVERTFGYSRDELIGRAVELLVPAAVQQHHPGYRQQFGAAPRARPMGAARALHGRRKDGTEVPLEIGLNPVQTAAGPFVLASVIDISGRRKTEREREELLAQLGSMNAELEERVRVRTADLRAMLTEREVLLREVHHRVKNNLSVISSLMQMQARSLEPGASRGALEQCLTRVQAIALIHDKLYHSCNFARVAFSDYVASLAREIFRALGAAPGRVELELELEPVVLPVDKAIPCALILNELISNALEHAFPGGGPGTVRVELAATERGRARLSVRDDGTGLPDGFDPSKMTSMGLWLVSALVEQLEGELRVEGRQGAHFELEFALGEA